MTLRGGQLVPALLIGVVVGAALSASLGQSTVTSRSITHEGMATSAASGGALGLLAAVPCWWMTGRSGRRWLTVLVGTLVGAVLALGFTLWRLRHDSERNDALVVLTLMGLIVGLGVSTALAAVLPHRPRQKVRLRPG